jgi:hypothetical protein
MSGDVSELLIYHQPGVRGQLAVTKSSQKKACLLPKLHRHLNLQEIPPYNRFLQQLPEDRCVVQVLFVRE